MPSKYMDPQLYRAAQAGDWEAIENLSEDLGEKTANGSNLLHVLAQAGGEPCANAAKQIVARKSKLAFMKNGDRETPLVIASRRGHAEVVQQLIMIDSDAVQQLIMIGSIWCSSAATNRDNAVLEAARFNMYDVFNLFVEQRPAGLRFDRSLNLSIDKRHDRIATLILSSCKWNDYTGPKGRTYLHAAAIANSFEIAKILLEKMSAQVALRVDARGWSALHYAAKLNHKEIAKLLLTKHPFMGYIVAKNDNHKTALHIAVIDGHLDVVIEIVSHCPDCWETTTRQKQNILHLAIVNEHKQVLEFILSRTWASELINKRDAKRNTPLHLYASTKSLESYSLLYHPFVHRNLLNNQRFTPLDIVAGHSGINLTRRQISIRDKLVRSSATSGSWWVDPEAGKSRDLRTEIDEESRRVKSFMVIATLIFTVAFAAGFTLPGGYDASKGNEGMAVLKKKAAFWVFIMSDALAMVLSVYAVVLHLMSRENPINELTLISLRHIKLLIIVAMTSSTVAFVSGLYAVIPVAAIKIYLILVTLLFLISLPLLAIKFARLTLPHRVY